MAAAIIIIVVLFVLFIISKQKISELENASANHSREIDELNLKNMNLNKEVTVYRDQINSIGGYDAYVRMAREQKQQLLDEIKSLNSEIETLNNEIISSIIDISDYDNLSSEECKNNLLILKREISDFVKAGSAVKANKALFETTRKYSNKCKQILTCFTTQCDSVINGLTLKNVDTARGKLLKAFENTNKTFADEHISLSDKFLEYKLQELTLVYACIEKKEQEKEEQKAIREQMLEEEKVRREIEREKAKLEKEEIQFRNEISKLMKYMQKATEVEKQLYVDKIKELEEKLKILEKDKENVLERERNTRAGFVYVISNIGSFGENVYKIGMTRRLEPRDRVKELSDASVPFEFDVHAMIFSEDAPTLESILHKTFKKYQVNKVNDRKEFFKVPLDEIEDVVKKNHNATVTFTKVAEAQQYRQSLLIEQQSI